MIYQTKQLLQRLSFLLVFLAINLHLAATTTDFDPWGPIQEQQFATQDMERQIVPFEYETFHLRTADLRSFLADAPERFTEQNASSHVLVLPMPNGEMERFEVYDAPVMEPKLADKYPLIRSFVGVGIDDPTASVRFDVTQFGFHAMILSARHSTVFIDPYSKDDTAHYITYYTNDYIKPGNDFECHLDTEFANNGLSKGDFSPTDLLQGDCDLRTYRLALTCTGEYAQFHGGTIAGVLAAMNTTMTRVNGVFERDVNATMVIVDNNEDLIFLNAGTDPYNNNNAGQLIGECHSQCVSIIGGANFDIGHIFTTGGGGLAGLGVVCRSNSKGEGVTGIGSPIGDPFDIDYVAHEIGHQFGANHTFNNSCFGNRNNATAVEPGSASTIMGYAGICSPNVQTNSDDYFHAISIEEMSNYINNSVGDNCAVHTETGNTPPTVEDVANYTLPVSTPFHLTAVGTDADENALTYCWEQMDVEIANMPPVSTNTGGPAFRSFDPTESPTRYFPRLLNLVNNSSFQWEELPSVSRNMSFRVTVRDNNMGSGCTAEDDVELDFTDSAGPFLVESPNNNVTWMTGFSETVTWDVANTDAAPVSCANVDILLSTDGGFTYPITLASEVPNTGSFDVTVPEEFTSTARVMVICSDNIFFDISNQNFTIEAPPGPTFTLSASPNNFNICGSEETVEIALDLASLLNFDEVVTLSTTGLPAGATESFGDNDIVPAAATTLTIGNLSAVANGTYAVTITGTSETVTMETVVNLTIANGAPAAAMLTSPINGATDQLSNTVLNWDAIEGGATYEVEIATSPAFGNAIIETASIETNSYATQNLTPNNIYYWQVGVTNACGESESEIFSFQTFTASCVTYNSTDTPLIISAAGEGNTVNSFININENLMLTGATVSIEVSHTWVGDLNAILSSPAGSNINLFDRPGYSGGGFGCGEDNLSLVFDDEASNTAADLENTCNAGAFAIQGIYQPIDALVNLVGENTQGNWELEMTDAADQDGGSLDSWSIELCFASGANEVLDLINNTWTVASGDSQPVPNSNLLATSSTSTAENISFIVLSLPTEGNLRLNGMPVMIGMTFTQADIDSGALVYTNNNESATEDQFNFDVLSAGGEWIPNQTFLINFGSVTISATALVSATIDCNGDSTGEITVNASGVSEPFSYSLNNGDPTGSNIFSNLPAGTYTVGVVNANGDATTTNTITIDEPEAIVVSASTMDNNVTIDASGGTGTLTYSVDGVNFQENNTFPNLDNGNYTITVMDENGCTETAMASINLIVDVSITTSPVTCAGDADGVLEILAVSGGVEPYEYNIGDGNGFGPNNVFTDLPAGNYPVTVRDANGYEFNAGSIPVSAPEFTVSGEVVDNNITVSNMGGVGMLQYSIDGGATFQDSNEFNGLENGVYLITAMDENGCTATTGELTINIVGLNEIIFDLEFRLFPNPVQEILTLELNQATGRNIQIQVFDVAGRLVQSIEMDKNSDYLQATLNVKELPAGSYELLLTDGSMLGKARFVKM